MCSFLPETVTKNREARIVVLNDIAQCIVEELRGEHPVHVFTWLNRKGRRGGVQRRGTRKCWRGLCLRRSSVFAYTIYVIRLGGV